jgi:hypothetical protein
MLFQSAPRGKRSGIGKSDPGKVIAGFVTFFKEKTEIPNEN